jgi:predicted adenine nucleotide alpha hydrolase (AANH) superfamily ATPase
MSNNYYQKSLQILNKLKKTPNFKPKLLFQVCCGPCSLIPLEKLIDIFDITVLYNNSNIFPFEEFDKRLNELKKIISELEQKTGKQIPLIVSTYNYQEFMKELVPFADQKEGGIRCHLCYKKRMEEAMIYADENEFDYFTTSLTSSRQKSAFVINKIGEELGKQAKKVKFFYSDFKKKAWAEIGYQIAKDKGIYLQEFCGCEYSKHEK